MGNRTDRGTGRDTDGNRTAARRRAGPIGIALVLVASLIAAVDADATPGPHGDVVAREPQISPTELGEMPLETLEYADPTEGLATIDPPDASPDGSAALSYPIPIPPGRGITPELALTYSSEGGNGWVGVGWDLSVGDISVDLRFGAPHFDEDEESETYLLDGEVLVPRPQDPPLADGEWAPRVNTDRADYTRRNETEYEQIIRRVVDDGGPNDYFWEVHDKEGNVRWYGGHPDTGGPVGTPLTDGGTPLLLDDSAVVRNEDDNIVRWLLSAERDVGVNLIRYRYEKVEYAGADAAWSATGCTGSAVCGQHIYLDHIEYTAAAQASGHPEDPAYEIHFLRDSELGRGPRVDAVVDALGGYVDVIPDRLGRVEARYAPRQPDGSRDHDNGVIAAAYDLAYETGPFGKSLLTSVTQVGDANTESATHTFSYYDDVRPNRTDYEGFAAEVDWASENDLDGGLDLDPTVDASALGASETNSGEGHAYIGFNPTIPQKVGSFGGSFQVGGGSTAAISEFIDLNGDGLPDKVFLRPDGVYYRENLNAPGDTTTGLFDNDEEKIDGLPGLSNDHNVGFQVSIEAHLGVSAMFGLGADFAWSDAYFGDVNADGLADFVTPGTVFFNRLDANGVPSFGSDSSGTFVPIPAGSPEVGEVEQLAAIEATLAENNPLVDTVRRWVAPYGGTVSIDAPVNLMPPPDAVSLDGVRVAVQHNATEIEVAGLTSASPSAFAAPPASFTRAVAAGDRLYFRTGSVDDGAGDQVEWSPTVTYTAIGGIADIATVGVDANGLSQTAFSTAADFTLAGRPDVRIAVPRAGTVDFTATITKTAATTDDLQVVLTHNDVTVPGSDVTIAADFVGTTPISHTFAVAAPRVPAEGEAFDPNVHGPDQIHAHLAVDSPIDLTAVSWDPRVTYHDDPATTEQDESIITIELPPEVEQYARRTHLLPAQAVQVPTDGDYDISAALTVAPLGIPAATPLPVVVSVKSAGGLVHQQQVSVAVPAVPLGPVPLSIGGVSLQAGTDYWVEASVRTRSYGAGTTISQFTIDHDEGGGADVPANTVAAPPALHLSGQQGIFPLAYRGWAVAGYAAADALATAPIQEDAFEIDTSGFSEDTEVVEPAGFDDDGNLDRTGFDPPTPDRSYAYTPQLTPMPIDGQADPIDAPVWRGTRDNLAASAMLTRSSRYGNDSAEVGPSDNGGAGGTHGGVTTLGVTAPTAALSFGVGPLSASVGVGPSFGLIDYQDLNGDGFPDVITPSNVAYTTPRGELLGAEPVNHLAVTNQDLTVSLGAGIDSGLIDIKGNSKGKTNANKGGSGAKGDDANDSGAGLGIGGSFDYSWTNPHAAGTSDQLTQAQGALSDGGAPEGEPGAPLQQTLSDVNGDGLADRVFVDTSGVWVHYNLGYGFTDQAMQIAAGGFESVESVSGGVSFGFSLPWGEFSGGVALNWNHDATTIGWRDVNGDGIIDRLARSPGGRPQVAFGTGSGLLSPVPYGDMVSFDAVAHSGQQVGVDTAQSAGGGFDFTVYIGPLCLVACYLVINPGASFQHSVSSSHADLEDVDGDGYADSLLSTDDTKLSVRLNNHGRTNLLESVANPLGGTMTLDYERTGNTVEHPDSIWVMNRVDIDDGRPGDGADVTRTTYEYGGEPRFDRLLRETFGYDQIIQREIDRGVLADPADDSVLRITTRRFLNDNMFVDGLPTEILLTDAGGGKIQQSTFDWGFRDVSFPPAGFDPTAEVDTVSAAAVDALDIPRQRSIASLMTDSTETWFDGAGNPGQVRSARFTYDGLGNILTETDFGETEDAGDDLVTEFGYANCNISSSIGCPTAPAEPSTLWSGALCSTWVSLPVDVRVTNRDTGELYRHRNSAPDMCDNAAAIHVEEQVDGSGAIAVTDLGFDDFGSYDRIVHPEGSDGLRYAVAYVYDDDRNSDVAQSTDYDLDAAAVADFLDSGSVAGATRTGLTATATFDPLSGRLAGRTDVNGNTISYTYDALGRITSISSPDPSDPEPLVRHEYHATDGAYSHAIARHYDRFHPGDTIDTVAFVDGIGRETQTKRDARIFTAPGVEPVDGRIVSGATNFDALGRAVEQFYPTVDTAASIGTYDGTTPSGPVITTEYTLTGLPKHVVRPDGQEVWTDYDYGTADAGGPLVWKTTVETRTLAGADPESRVVTTYNTIRDVTLAIDDQPHGEPAPLRSTYVSDPLGQLLSFVDTSGNVTTHTYDLLGRQTSTDTPDGGLVELGWDASGRQISRVTPNLRAGGEQVEFRYELNRLVEIDYPADTHDVTYEYGGAAAPGNAAGRLLRGEDGSRVLDVAYDAAGNVTRETAEMKTHQWDNPGFDRSKVTWTTEWTYDGLGRLETMTFPDSEVLMYGYDSGGQLQTVAGHEDGLETVIIGFDIEGNPITEDQPRTWEYAYLDDRQYDHLLLPRREELGNGAVTTYEYDPDSLRLTDLVTTSPRPKAGTDPEDLPYREIQDFSYSYDLIGNVLGYSNDLPPARSDLFGGATTQQFDYDAFNRVVGGSGEWNQATGKLRHYTFSVAYDEHGNVIEKDQTDDIFNGKKDLEQKETTYSFERDYDEPAPRHASGVGRDTYHYDDNGNLLGITDRRDKWIRQVEWDASDRMVRITDGPSDTIFTYDGAGRRRIERGPSGETLFVNEWVTIRNTNEHFKHIWMGDVRLATQRDDGPYEELKRYFLHIDVLGGTNMVTDYVGDTFQHHEYFPTGEVWVDEKSTIFRTPYQYGGEYVDEHRLMMSIGARWYDQNRELFYSPDPLLVDEPGAVIEQYALSSAYAYAGSNPTTYVDPSGFRFIWTQKQADQIIADTGKALGGQPPSQGGVIAANLAAHNKTHTDVSGTQKRRRKVQAFADRFDAKPFISIDLSEGTVKFSFGAGPRLKKSFGSKPQAPARPSAAAPATAATAAPPRPSTAAPSAASTAPPRPSSAPPGATTTQDTTQSGATTQASTQATPKPPTPKPLPRTPAVNGNRTDQ